MARTLQSWLDTGAQLIASGRLPEAEQLAARLLEQVRGNPAVHLFAADAADAAGNRAGALARLMELPEPLRDTAPVAIRTAQLLLALRRRQDARAVAMTVPLGADPNEFRLTARLLTDCLDPEAARALLEHAHERFPNDVPILSDLAMAEFHVNRIDAAERHLGRLLELDPFHPGAVHLRSALRTQTAERNHVDDLERRLQRDTTRRNFVVGCSYALAKEYEDLGDYEKSFAALSRGAAAYRSRLSYDSATELNALATIRARFTSDVLPRLGSGFDAEGPIFIVGMPRTGTTLVERILTSHSEVSTVGELTDFPLLLSEMTQQQLAANPQLSLEIDASFEIDFRELGRRYLDAARQLAGDRKFFIDKLPYNYLYCGYILTALPGAKIIHLRRDPLDTCYAVYKTLFFNAYSYSYDLDDLADYYIGYRAQMEHWHRVLPGRILDVSYEALVQDPEAHSRRILDWIGLPWQPSVLAFHEQARPSMTASAMQVRRPIYTHSIGAWRRIEPHFAGVRARLDAAGLLDQDH